MCNLYSMTMPLDAMRNMFDVAPENSTVGNMEPRRSVWPKHRAPIVVADGDIRTMCLASWGFLTPNKSRKTGKWLLPTAWNNTREDKVWSTPLWYGSFKNRRCLVPATAYAEATGSMPATYHWANVKDAEGFAFAGIWKHQIGTFGDTDVDETVFSIMTTTPNEFAVQYHNRMPVILDRRDYDQWLRGSADEAYSLLGGLPADRMQLIGEGEGMREQPEM
ncbi:SOS response-associated peptidase [Roseobacter sp. A03A-229]